jgi:hypothetical protein
MIRPLRLEILGKWFGVAYINPDHVAWKGEDLAGRVDPDRQRILIREGQPLESEQDTVLHEVIHAVDAAMSGEEDQELDEAQVTRLATGLLAVFKRNPGFTKWLLKSPPKNVDPQLSTD